MPKKDTRRDAWDMDYLTKADWEEIEEATKIHPKRDYTIWIFALFFVSVLILIGDKS